MYNFVSLEASMCCVISTHWMLTGSSRHFLFSVVKVSVRKADEQTPDT